MAWILMQPAEYDESTKAAAHLDGIDECLFDMDPNGARFKPISYGSRVCTGMELNVHLFFGESASG